MSTRRTILLGTAGLVLGTASCSGAKSGGSTPSATGAASPSSPAATPPGSTTTSSSGAASTPSAASTSSATPSSSATSTSSAASGPSVTSTPGAVLWTPNAGELDPDVKRVAVEYVQANEHDPTIIDAQYGGLLDTSASVLVVTSAATYDVRLVQAQPRWKVTEIHPSDPGAAASTLSSAATGVLANTRIHLPPAGRADIQSGNVHDTVLQTLQALSEQHALSVSVVRSGHPTYVFGTNRLSDHPRGRAVDVFAIDGHPVVDPGTSPSLVDGLMRSAVALGAYNVGGPRQLSGAQYFSDRTHHDHVHLGFAT